MMLAEVSERADSSLPLLASVWGGAEVTEESAVARAQLSKG